MLPSPYGRPFFWEWRAAPVMRGRTKARRLRVGLLRVNPGCKTLRTLPLASTFGIRGDNVIEHSGGLDDCLIVATRLASWGRSWGQREQGIC